MNLPLQDGKSLDTANLRPDIEPCFCSQCGERLGWFDTGYSGDPGILFCDECAEEPDVDCSDETLEDDDDACTVGFPESQGE